MKQRFRKLIVGLPSLNALLLLAMEHDKNGFVVVQTLIWDSDARNKISSMVDKNLLPEDATVFHSAMNARLAPEKIKNMESELDMKLQSYIIAALMTQEQQQLQYPYQILYPRLQQEHQLLQAQYHLMQQELLRWKQLFPMLQQQLAPLQTSSTIRSNANDIMLGQGGGQNATMPMLTDRSAAGHAYENDDGEGKWWLLLLDMNM